MKPINAQMLTLINTHQRFLVAELYTITLVDGTADYFTNLDIPITNDGHVFKANSLRIDGLKFKITVGLEVDEQEIKISAFPDNELASADFFSAVQAGLLDGAYIKRQRAFWSWTVGEIPYDAYGAAPVDVVTLFTGKVSTISKIGRTHAIVKLKSPMILLDMDMPRNSYQAGCIWNLYDDSINTGIVGTGCKLLAFDFVQNGVVESATESTIVVDGGVITPTGADSLANYAQGTLVFTGGANTGLRTSIKTNDTTTIYFRFPPITGILPGDTFQYYPGCSKKFSTCDDKFNNLVNFRGFPRVPPIVLSV